jgi:hypothetical protein
VRWLLLIETARRCLPLIVLRHTAESLARSPDYYIPKLDVRFSAGDASANAYYYAEADDLEDCPDLRCYCRRGVVADLAGGYLR